MLKTILRGAHAAARLQSQTSAAPSDDQEAETPHISRYLFQVEEAERRRIGRELHDDTAQGLTLVRFYLGMLQQIAEKENAQETIGEALAVIDRTIEGLRRIIGRLSPQALERLGLIGSIRKEARSLSSAGVTQVDVRVSGRFGRLSLEIELALYRLVQEALHNIAKHARAKHVEIDLSREGRKVRLMIIDDGVGFGRNATFPQNSYGVFGMRERIRSLGGTFRMGSRRGRGTRIQVSISDPPPLAAQPVTLPRPLSNEADRQRADAGHAR